jgi:hypothetical protein
MTRIILKILAYNMMRGKPRLKRIEKKINQAIYSCTYDELTVSCGHEKSSYFKSGVATLLRRDL